MPRHFAVSLTEKQQDLIDRLVRSGRFHGTTDVIAASLRLLEDQEKEAEAFIAGLEKQVVEGLRSGDAAPMESGDRLVSMFRRRK